MVGKCCKMDLDVFMGERRGQRRSTRTIRALGGNAWVHFKLPCLHQSYVGNPLSDLWRSGPSCWKVFQPSYLCASHWAKTVECRVQYEGFLSENTFHISATFSVHISSTSQEKQTDVMWCQQLWGLQESGRAKPFRPWGVSGQAHLRLLSYHPPCLLPSSSGKLPNVVRTCKKTYVYIYTGFILSMKIII